MSGYRQGVSVIVCCYNSEHRIGPTLEHLFAQKTEDINWEIILVDNRCTDRTVEVSNALYAAKGGTVPFRIVVEQNAGLIYARNRGIAESIYDLILFVDDDNWLIENYIQQANSTFRSLGHVAVLGGIGEPMFEAPPPTWFHDHLGSFAMGDQAKDALGQVVKVKRVYGAGMLILRQALDRIHALNFKSQLTGRKGKSLSSGEDTELCDAFRMAGYKVYCDRNLTFKHVMPANRLKWSYLVELYKALGTARPIHEAYDNVERWHTLPKLNGKIPFWASRALHLTVEFFQSEQVSLIKAFFGGQEGDTRVLLSVGQLAHIRFLLKQRSAYHKTIIEIWALKERAC